MPNLFLPCLWKGCRTLLFLALTAAWPALAGTPQSITFPVIGDRITTDAPFVLTATASSGLPITYSLTSPAGVATVSSGAIILTGTAGSVTVKASQAGNGTYDAAPDAYRSFIVGTAVQKFAKLATNAHGFHEHAIKPDGTLWAWGGNQYGQHGDGTVITRNTPVKVGTATTWASVSCGDYHTAALRTDGSLYTSGYNSNGQLGTANTTNRSTLTRIGSLTWLAVSCGESHTVAIRSDGTLWACGDNQYGQLGINNTTQATSLTQVGSVTTWTAVSCGLEHTLALRSDGTLWAWGRNSNGRLGDGSFTQRNAPVKIGTATNWTAISAGGYHSLGLRGSTLWGWGNNGDGQLGSDGGTTINAPVQASGPATWAAISAGDFHSTGRQTDGTLWAWGNNYRGQCGTSAPLSSSTPLQVPTAGSGIGAAILGRFNSTTVLQPTGTLQGLGGHPGLVYRLEEGPAQLADTGFPAWKQVAVGQQFNVGIAVDGTLWTWGLDTLGQLGNGTAGQTSTPTKISEDNRWTSASAYDSHGAALRSDGTLWTWGNNTGGKLGDGTTTSRDAPVQVGTGTTWTRVACGRLHTAALQSDGTLWAWGYNAEGEVGDGSSTNRPSPVKIGTATDWTHVACGYDYSMAVRADGSLWGWGSNSNSNLGDGTSTDRYVPVRIGTASNWLSVDCGTSHTVGLRTDGTLWTWGYNNDGRLGDGTSTSRTSPVQIGTETKWTSIVVGSSHSFATRRDGTLWAWGTNINGQLGDGTGTPRNAPVQVGTATNWASIDCHTGSLGVRTDGTLWGWGSHMTDVGAGLNYFEPNTVWPPRASQTITFPVVPALKQGQPVTMTAATASSGLPITCTVAGPATLVGSTLTATGPGTITVAAYQNGSPAWYVAQSVMHTQALSPQLSLTGNGQAIANADATPSTADHTDFGRVLTTAATLTRTFTIANSDLADLTLGTVTLSGPHAADFTVTTAPATTVPLSTATTFAITFDPSAEGPRQATVTFTSNDVAALSFSFALAGNGYNRAHTLDFPALADHLSTDAAFTTGATLSSGQPVTYTLLSNPAGIASITGGILTLSGTAGSVTVKASYPADALYDGVPEITRTFVVGTASQRFVKLARATSSYHGAGIRSDGTLWTWGDNYYGQLGDGTTTTRGTPVQVGTATTWVEVACGSQHTVAIQSDGTLWAWGENGFGQLGNSTFTHQLTPVQIGSATTWSTVACGQAHTVARRTDGTLWAWGSNGAGQLGIGSNINRNSPVQIGTLTLWSDTFACGQAHTAARRTNGQVYTWGDATYGQLGSGNTTSRNSPAQLNSFQYNDLACGMRHTVAVRSDGTLWGFGNNFDLQLGTSLGTSITTPAQIGTATTWAAVACGLLHTVARRTDGTLWACGRNSSGQAGNGTTTALPFSPAQIGTATDWTAAVGGLLHSLALRADGTLWAWGDNDFGQLADGGADTRKRPFQPAPDPAIRWSAVASGWNQTAALRADGTLWQWCQRSQGQVGSVSNWSAVAVGWDHAAALRTDGTLWTWGDNIYGQLGDGTTTTRELPVQVGAGHTWTRVACGRDYTLAIRSDGTLWAWGQNLYGQLGDGTFNTDRTSPVPVGSDTNWASITCGEAHTIGIRTDGTLWTWGMNFNGQLGDGTTTQRLSPLQIGNATDWTSAAGGQVHTVAVRANGTLWAWGANFVGSLGDGTTTQRTSPVQVGTATNWARAACGDAHSLALRTDGTLWAWGENSGSTLGDGTATQRNSPVPIGSATNWTSIGGALYHSMGLRSDGTLWTWGYSYFGQLPKTTTPKRAWPLPASQSLTFPALPSLTLGQAVTLAATASSGLPIAYTVVGPATLVGNVLTPTSTGSITIAAYQPGDLAWRVGDSVMQTIASLTAAQSWRQTHFGTTANTGTAADTFDADNDGLPNLIEYAFALSPTASSSSAQLPRPQHSGNAFTVTFPQPPGVTGVTYGATYSPSLLPGSWLPITDTGTGGNHVFSVPIGPGGQQMFVRLEVTPIP